MAEALFDQFLILKNQILSVVFKICILSKNWWGCLDIPIFKNLTLFIALWVIKNQQKLGINSFRIFWNLAKTKLFESH
jgi:hypothetical protein